MKTTSEMIAVMEAFERGEKVQVVRKGRSDWTGSSVPSWDWYNCDYRIAPKPKKQIKMLAWFNGITLIWCGEGHSMTPLNGKRVPSEDKIIEVEE